MPFFPMCGSALTPQADIVIAGVWRSLSLGVGFIGEVVALATRQRSPTPWHAACTGVGITRIP